MRRLTMDKKKLQKHCLSKKTKTLVISYFVARAASELKAEQVKPVQREILKSIQGKAVRGKSREITHQVIVDPKDDWLLSDGDADLYFAECDRVEKERGIKPKSMEKDHCPLLTLEEGQRKTERALIEHTGKPFGVSLDMLLCTKNGLENKQKWIDLICGLVVTACPEDFQTFLHYVKNPRLTG